VIDTPGERARSIAVRLAAIGQDGLTYATDDYDVDRYLQVRVLAAELLALVSGREVAELTVELGRDSGYATPKVDVRAAVFDDNERVLLLKERSDGRWALPGGWADPGETPTTAAVREVLEETGYAASVVKLIACWDRDVQGNTPPLPVHVYKLFFLCTVAGAPKDPQPRETLDVGWFDVGDLPTLSTGRNTAAQIQRARAHHRDPALPTEID
jgi:ADP-ribose pyrophosphatase YjhB (NUDIX family)